MKNLVINIVLVILLSTLVLETISGIVISQNSSIEITDEQRDEKKETEKDNQLKEKIFLSNSCNICFHLTGNNKYCEYTVLTTSSYSSRLELPPKMA